MKEVILKPNKKDVKHFHMSMKAVGGRKIQGFASTRFPDRVDDVVLPEALAASMDIYMSNPVVLLDHDRECPIGKTISYQVVQDGLFVTCEIMEGTEDADEAWKQIEFGARNAFSIGFIPKQIDLTEGNPVISELELLEISVVTIPANRESLFSIAKAFELGTDLKDSAPKKMGFEKTKAEMEAHLKLIEQNFKGMLSEQRIYIETYLIRLQDIVKASDNLEDVRSQIEARTIELKIEEALASLAECEQ